MALLESPSRARRCWWAVSDVGADNEADQTQAYGSGAFGRDLQIQVVVDGDVGRGESTSATIVMVFGTW